MFRRILIIPCVLCMLLFFTACSYTREPGVSDLPENNSNNSEQERHYLKARMIDMLPDNLDIPDGVIVSSFKSIDRLAVDYPDLSKILLNNTADDFFYSSSYLFFKYYYSSSEKNINFLSVYVEGTSLTLEFNIESSEFIDGDIISKPILLEMELIENIKSFNIITRNVLSNTNDGGWNYSPRDIIYY